MIKHQQVASQSSNLSAVTIILSPDEFTKYVSENSDSDCQLKMLPTAQDKDLLSVTGKDKIRFCNINSNTNFEELQQNVLVYSTTENPPWYVTHQLRSTNKYQYLPTNTKFGLLSSLIDHYKVRNTATKRIVPINQICGNFKEDSHHPFDGLYLSSNKYIESIAVSYLLLSSTKLRVDACDDHDFRIGGKKIIDTNLLKFTSDDIPIDFLHIPLFKGIECFVIKIQRCKNLAEACERYLCHEEPFDQIDNVNYHIDYTNSSIYTYSIDTNTVLFHRSLKDTCLEDCASSLCKHDSDLVDLLDDDLIHNLDTTFSNQEANIITSAPLLPPKEQRVKYVHDRPTIESSNTVDISTLTAEDFTGLGRDVWAEFGQKLDVINKLPVHESDLSKVLIKAAVLDMFN